MAHIENARRVKAGAVSLKFGGFETQHNPIESDVQRAIGAGLVNLPDVTDMAVILRHRLDTRQRIWLGIACLVSLPLDIAEELAEAVLHDLREGEPIPPFTSLRDEARDWATFASPGELKAYFSAIWNRLSEAERAKFLSAARPKRRAA